ncbi:MAG: PHB depolymerase family esterase [Gammaproteobacteria bacterium]|nr:PHB depolymerase family esterase [Gammaproteobacteria bacterium]
MILAASALLGCDRANEQLPAGEGLNPTEAVDIGPLAGRVTVSGVSSGGYMAVQAHVALSDRVSGAAVVAAGPYHCAQGSVQTALGPCLKGEGLELAPLLEYAETQSAQDNIADLGALSRTRAWILHSPVDSVVSPLASEALADFYRAFLPRENVAIVTSVESAHGWPTVSAGGPCGEMSGDYLNACDYDLAGTMLQHLYGDLESTRADEAASQLRELDLSRLVSSESAIADTAYAYVPASCSESTSKCRLHISFHGCRQGAEFIGDSFARQAGINEWAATNRIVVVYPQIEKSMFNPQGCWDWWGYTGEDYDLASGPQVASINAIIKAFAGNSLLD